LVVHSQRLGHMHCLQRKRKSILVLTPGYRSHEAAESKETYCMKIDRSEDIFHYIAASQVLGGFQESLESREYWEQLHNLTSTLWNISSWFLPKTNKSHKETRPTVFFYTAYPPDGKSDISHRHGRHVRYREFG
jgi:hypothetical protein